jgi:hypothetical protein
MEPLVPLGVPHEEQADGQRDPMRPDKRRLRQFLDIRIKADKPPPEY